MDSTHLVELDVHHSRVHNIFHDNIYSRAWVFIKHAKCVCGGRGGRSGCAMVLGKLPVPERPTIWMIVGQGPIARAFLLSAIFLFSFSVFLGGGPI